MPPKIYRPPIPSTYIEPEELPDPLEGMECLHQPLGRSLWESKQTPPPRTDLIQFNPLTHQQELHKNANWEGCNEFHRILITRILKEFWDVFSQEGLRNPIIGFQFWWMLGRRHQYAASSHVTALTKQPLSKTDAQG